SSLRFHGPANDNLCADRSAGASWTTERCEVAVRIAEPTELWRTVSLFTSRDDRDPRDDAQCRIETVARTAIEAHERAWAERWKRADVTIDGAPGIERALRFAMYHLIASANPDDSRCSIGARALSGEAYRGHVFWDTELFMLP